MLKHFWFLIFFLLSFIGFAQKSQKYSLSVNKFSGTEFISKTIKIDSAKNNPFISFSVAIRGENINKNILAVYFKNRYDKWIQLTADENNNEVNAWYAITYINTDIKSTQLKIVLTKPTNFSSIELNFYYPKNTDFLQKKYNTSNVKSKVLKADCGCARPETIKRTGWCPDGSCIENQNPVYTDVKFLIVHHTAGSNTSSDWAAVVRSIWNYHVNIRGWDDIGYNFLIDTNGNIYEGRADDTRGAHFSGHNSETSGMALMGTFTSVTPSAKMLYALEDLLVWKSCDKSIDPLSTEYHASSGLTLNTISGHRDGGVTECPGNKTYELLPDIRNNVSSKLNSCVLNINDFSNDFIIYPNPFKDKVYILNKGLNIADITINCYDVNGRLVLNTIKKNINNTIGLDLTNLSKGIYILRLSSDDRQTHLKVIKN